MYSKTNWAPGDIITSQKLSNMEQGIRNNDLSISNIIENIIPAIETNIIPIIEENVLNLNKIDLVNINIGSNQSGTIKTLDKTWRQIHDTLANKGIIAIESINNVTREYLIEEVSMTNNQFVVIINNTTYTTTNQDDYPIYHL